MNRTLLPYLRCVSIRGWSRSLLALVAFLVLVANAVADTVIYTGTTAGGPIWNRPQSGNPPTALSAVGTAVPWSSQAFTVNLAGSYVFQSTATTVGFDNFSFLYFTSFNPATPFTNVLIGNDDNPVIGLSGFTFNLTAGTNYIFVITGFLNDDFGTFSNSITGPGNILGIGGPAGVPESGPGMILFGLIAAGLVIVRSRRSVTA